MSVAARATKTLPKTGPFLRRSALKTVDRCGGLCSKARQHVRVTILRQPRRRMPKALRENFRQKPGGYAERRHRVTEVVHPKMAELRALEQRIEVGGLRFD